MVEVAAVLCLHTKHTEHFTPEAATYASQTLEQALKMLPDAIPDQYF